MTPLVRSLFASTLLAFALAACATEQNRQAAADAQAEADAKFVQGRMIARAQCSGCHEIGETGASPHPDAPPFRIILGLYNPDSLELDLLEGMRIGHADMPRFDFDPRTVDALLTYLKAIQAWEEARDPGAVRPAAM